MDERYTQGKIYKLVSKMTTEIYLGSTIQPLKERLSAHKSAYKRYLNKKWHYMKSFELLQHEDVVIELIEDYPCASKNELEAREGKWIKELIQSQIICVNKVLPGQKKGGSYQYGKIYRLVSKLTDKIYIGSTIQSLKQRLMGHKTGYKRFLNQKMSYLTSFELLQNEDVDIELIEDYPCASKNELELREGILVKENQDICVNKVFPGRTKKKYRKEHKDKIKDYKAKYYEEHKDNIKEQKVKYREEHKVKIKERRTKYREEHKDKIKERNAKPFQCECGSIVRTDCRNRHLKTKKHKDFISTQSRK